MSYLHLKEKQLLEGVDSCWLTFDDVMAAVRD